ncbi:MAG: hypothetical protein L3J96_04510, partial [Thermoplasmata archaeon]|nr:hypothetical protein [Thermoplasmata archaeon]
MVNKYEVVWTLATVGLVTGVAVWSTILLYQIDTLPAHPDEYVDVTGHQWYWEFCYPSNVSKVGCFNTSYDPTTQAVSGGDLWAAPGTVVQINVTASDVIHSFNIPDLGVRLDAIPGRMNSIAFAAYASIGSLRSSSVQRGGEGGGGGRRRHQRSPSAVAATTPTRAPARIGSGTVGARVPCVASGTSAIVRGEGVPGTFTAML